MFRFCLLIWMILLLRDDVDSSEDCVMDLAFLIDYTRNIAADANGKYSPERWNLILGFCQNVVRALDVGPSATRVASHTFGEYDGAPNFDFDKGHRKDRVVLEIGLIRNSKEDGSRHPGDGINFVNGRIFNPKYGDRSAIPNVLLLITKEVSDSDIDEVISKAKKLKDLGTTIICIGISDAVNATLMGMVVTAPPSENYFAVSELESIDTIVDPVALATCRAVRNATNPDTTSVQPTSIPDSDCVMDLTFLIDYSRSIAADADGKYSSERWNLILGFCQNVVRALDVGPSTNHIAFFAFGKQSVRLKFDLDQGQRKDRVVDDIGNIKNSEEDNSLDDSETVGGRNPGVGLAPMSKRAFNTTYGDRLAIPNVLLLITKEVSDDDMKEVMEEAKKLKDLGTTIICIGISDAVDATAMRMVVSEPSSENYFAVSELESLDTIVDAVALATCTSAKQPKSSELNY